MPIPASALSVLSMLPVDTPQGLPTGNSWPLLQTLGVFVGIPVAAMALIWGLVLLRSGGRRVGGSTDSLTAVFSGPYAGEVDAAQRSGGAGPVTETGEDGGMHREVARVADPDDGTVNSSGEADASGAASAPEQAAAGRSGGSRSGGSGSGGAGARW